MSPPRLTIVTPSLNQGRYLERTIRSVLDQGYANLEYIVIDGGSTDASVEILRRYDAQLAYWASEPDRGQSDAINKGLARATGDVVAYINSDDYYLPGAFEAALAPFADPDVPWVAGACRYENPDGSLHSILRPRPPSGPRPLWVRMAWYAPQAASFWRRELFDEVGGFRDDLHFVFDTEFGLRLVLAGRLPHLVDRELAVRYLHDEAKSADPSRFVVEQRRVARELLADLPRREKVVEPLFRLLLWRRWLPKLNPLYLQYVVRRRLGLLHVRRRSRDWWTARRGV